MSPTPLEESDYYPYGGEMAITNGDPNSYKFSGKERDTESGLDDLGARYDSSNLGRFMTPDWAARPTAVPYAVFGDPQSLNLYGYVRNDPVSLVDADGHQNDKSQQCDSKPCTPPVKTKLEFVTNPKGGFMIAQVEQKPFTVTVNSRPADIPGGKALDKVGIDHQWITTSDGASAGMGTAKGVPQSDAPGVETQVVDHTGQVPTKTVTYTNVDKTAINTYLKVGTPTGRWAPGVNDCNSWTRNAINQSTPHDITIGIYGVPISTAHDVVEYEDGSLHSPGGP